MLITTDGLQVLELWSCFCFCKGNQFYANHNVSLLWEARLVVVFAFAKVINFMLITTASQ